MKAEEAVIFSAFASGAAFSLVLLNLVGNPLPFLAKGLPSSSPLLLELFLVFLVALNTYFAYRARNVEWRGTGVALVSIVSLASPVYSSNVLLGALMSIYAASLSVLLALEVEGKLNLS